MSNRIISVNKALKWIETQMSSYNRASWGIYERIRINENQRICWVRPDCNSEIARVMMKHKLDNGNADYDDMYQNIINWVLSAQDNDEFSVWYGSFPFYLYDGKETSSAGNVRYQNDNGKVLIALLDLYEMTQDERLLGSAKKLADFWVKIQRPEGYFHQKDNGVLQPFPKCPCFVLWLMAGLFQCYYHTKEEKYLQSAHLALEYILKMQLENGRFLTSYEIEKTEDWRPVSSETAIAVYCLSKAYQYVPNDKVKEAANKALEFVLKLQDKSGAILNCNEESLGASLQEDNTLCDLVYTEGYALMAFCQAYQTFGAENAKDAAIKLGDFLMKIQCEGESYLWDGAWRGSYSLTKQTWWGRADQNNQIDEGGMYSVYTGWCTAPILYGLLMLEHFDA